MKPESHEFVETTESMSSLESFYCGMSEEPWITEEGWLRLLRSYASQESELLWLEVPDYHEKGRLNTIKSIK